MKKKSIKKLKTNGVCTQRNSIAEICLHIKLSIASLQQQHQRKYLPVTVNIKVTTINLLNCGYSSLSVLVPLVQMET